VEQPQMNIWVAVYNIYFLLYPVQLFGGKFSLEHIALLESEKKKNESVLYYYSMNFQKLSKVIIFLTFCIMVFIHGVGS
jgi:hypothetical protein